MVRPWLYSLLGLAGFLLVMYLLITFGLPVVMPFVVALVIAELLEPLVKLLTFKGRVPRGIASGLVLVLFLGLLTLGLTAAVARLATEIKGVIAQLPYLYAYGMDMGTRFAEQFGAFNQTLPGTIQDLLANNLETLQSWLGDQLENLAGSLSVISSLPSVVTNILIAAIATFFMSRDREVISNFLIRLFPSMWHDQLRKVKTDVWTSSMGWAKAQLMLITLTMIQTIIGLSLIGAKYAVTMGVLVGVADLLPVLGPAAVYLPWAVYAFVAGDTVFAVKLLVLYGIVTAIRQVLESKIVGDQVGLHPLAILFALYLGFQFFGAVGFVVGPLLAILLKSLIKSGLLPIFQERPPKQT